MKTGLIVRDAADWVRNHLRDLQADLMRVDASNIHHIETCPGCPTCDCLMQFYSGCEGAGVPLTRKPWFTIRQTAPIPARIVRRQIQRRNH